MRIESISLRDHPPIRQVDLQTSSSVVIIAGANGSGKTRLKEAIVNSFRQPAVPQASMQLTATRQEEEAAWGGKIVTVQQGQDCPALRTYLSTRNRAEAYVGTVVQIDSDRAVQPVRFESISLATEDPDDQDFSYSWYLNAFINRWQDLVNRIYKKAANRDQKIARFVKENPEKPGQEALSLYPDPFIPYQDVFAQLLPGKTLEPIDPKTPREFHYRNLGSQPMSFTSLSSGEQEVIKVAFNLVWKKITHSIILVDEPELHLHPTLTFRLIETLKGIGGGTNQLILFTHSADLISTYYSTGNVFFIDSAPGEANQAHKLSTLTESHTAVAQAAGANLGLFAVGKRLVFVEGKEASVDRLVYHKVAQNTFPDSYVMPIGSVENLLALRSVIDELTSVVFGIDLFMIRDRDGLSDDVVVTLEKNARFRCIPRRHVENYLLDPDVLAEVAKMFYLPGERREIVNIRSALDGIAASSIMAGVLWNVRERIRVLGAMPLPRIAAVASMTQDQLADALKSEVTAAVTAVSGKLSQAEIERLVREEYERLSASVSSNDWTTVLPGKPIFNRFCKEFLDVEPTRVREAYADFAAREKPEVFEDIARIFQGFSDFAGRNGLTST